MADRLTMRELDFDRLSLRLRKRFTIIKKLGSGAAATVFLAVDREYGDYQVALKVLSPEADYDVGTVQRFCDEYEALCKIHHPNLIEAYALVEHSDVLAYTMEYIPGRTLLETATKKRLAPEEVVLIIAQVLAALSILHENGIFHRDIKLENVLVRSDGLVKLSDLGLQKSYGSTSRTRTGVLLGTTHYLAPEYARHGIYDAQSDLYAVGLLMYECIVGKRWLEAKDGMEALKFVTEKEFAFPKMALAGLPSKFKRILECALDPEPRFRFKSAAAMRKALLSEHGTVEEETIIEAQETGAFSRDFFASRELGSQTKKRKSKRLIASSFAASFATALTLIIAVMGIPQSETSKIAPVVAPAMPTRMWVGEVIAPAKKLKGNSKAKPMLFELEGDGSSYRLIAGLEGEALSACGKSPVLRLDTFVRCGEKSAISLSEINEDTLQLRLAQDGVQYTGQLKRKT